MTLRAKRLLDVELVAMLEELSLTSALVPALLRALVESRLLRRDCLSECKILVSASM